MLLAFALACGSPEPAATPAAPPVAAAPAAAPAPSPGVPIPAAFGLVPAAEGATSASPAPPVAFANAAGQVACPVMGMAMTGKDDVVSYADHGGKRYFFCCDSCEKLFLADPETYADGRYLEAHGLDPSAPAACEEEKG
jgi:YHS domain-containing protein